MSYIDNEILERLIATMVEGFARIEKKLDHMNHLKECLNGDKLLDNVDLAELLGVSQRTLARYREKGIIRYYCMDDNGKNFYLASEIQEFLKQRGKIKT
ncbi:MULTISPECIES: helix-turn-helix domain-containing protein [Bacteroidaceae]|uniref:helix-turn-helix domain-containing protein n=1 Tax=Bacteroidaceae TaxID=815 RepID=UPI0015E7CF6B|nr:MULTISPECIES: helix-turn-helix domain-containing protein [Bacteroidaceae]MCE8488504.1 helix-turn-helix domain-containing protein [Bacteroides thetaiotaomicron]